MNRYGVMFLVLLSLSIPAHASESAHASEYAEVLGKANRMVDALAAMERVSLAYAMTDGLAEVINLCKERVGPMHRGMGVVFRINGDGQVTRTWTRNGTEYEKCFATAMKDRIHYEPSNEPFYTAIDYGRS